MDKYIYDESNGLWYELQGDYYIPCLILPTEKEHKPIGLWGQRHKRYLQEHKRTVYISLLTSGKLNNYLADIDEQATEMMFRLVEQMADKEGVTEQLKVENPELIQRELKIMEYMDIGLSKIEESEKIDLNKEKSRDDYDLEL